MRYWIWWNDLIQGPFELEELTSLKAFSEDLPVCMEDREDWLPASRVADLSSAIEQLRARRVAPRVPPPPPPKHPPAVTPLQGEFFGEPPGQQPLLDSEDGPKGPYAYRPVTGESEFPASYFVGQATMPFHFAHPPEAASAVIEMPRPQTSRITFAPPPVIKESPVQEPVEEPVPDEEKRETKPSISLELLQEKPSLAPSLEEPSGAAERKPEWLPWILGIVLAVGTLGSVGYWLMDRASTHSAIAEANRLESPKPAVQPVATPLPTAPVSIPQAPARARRVLKNFPPAVTRTSGKVFRAVKKHLNSIQSVKGPSQKLPPPSWGRTEVGGQIPTAISPPSAPSPTRGEGIVGTDTKPTAVKVEEAKTEKVTPDPWKGRQNEAIDLVLNKTLSKSKTTIGSQARVMLQEMHEKELLHAADTGERLYLPDKISWTALQEEGPHYRVYLNFLAWQANGERVQSRSYPFLVDLEHKGVRTEDSATQQDILTQTAEQLNFKHNPMAVDIESVLGGVDHYNKQKMRAIIVKNNRRNRNEQKNIAAGLAAAKEKVTRAIVFFRRAYSDKILQNIAKAYDFSELLK